MEKDIMILFRTDGNSRIGMGHLMRCLTIAEALRKKGEVCMFALYEDGLRAFVEEKGFSVYVCEENRDDPARECEALRECLAKAGKKAEKPEYLVIDSYSVNDFYLRELRQWTKVVYMDDLAAFAYPVDVLINYNIYADAVAYETLYREAGEEMPELLLGIQYAPLREQFRVCDAKPDDIRAGEKDAFRVFVSTGGADPIHLALALVQEIKAEQGCETRGKEEINEKEANLIQFDIMLGAMNPDKVKIREYVTHCPNVFLYENVTDVSERMRNCDLAVSAAGSTLYELCACGIPTITYVLADNQIAGAEAFAKAGIMRNLGDVRKMAMADAGAVARKILDEVADAAKANGGKPAVSRSMRQLVDGAGAERIAMRLTK